MWLAVAGVATVLATYPTAFAAIPGVSLVAGVDTRPEALAAFCDRHAIAQRFTSLADALAWGQFDAVTNVTPDAAHYATTMPVLAAGKHILCEKPLATNRTDATAMAAAAERACSWPASSGRLRWAAKKIPFFCRPIRLL